MPNGLGYVNDDGTLTISGTPMTAGDYECTFTASNMAGTADVKVSITVYSKPVFSNSQITLSASKGEAMSCTVTPVSGNHLTWTFSGTLPKELTVTSDDKSLTVSGTTISGGDFECTITATNPAGSAEVKATVIVFTKPSFDDIDVSSIMINVLEGDAITSRTIKTTAGNHITWSTSGSLPDGVSVTSADAIFTISRTPSTGTRRTYSYRITASNYAGSSTVEIVTFVASKTYRRYRADRFLYSLMLFQFSNIETLKLNEYVTDLSAVDELPNLIALDLTEARLLTAVDLRSNDKVMSIDIHGNTSVKELNIAGSAVTFVNAENCSSLELLNAEDCWGLETLLYKLCAISELYLSGCLELMTLDFTGNALRKFNARGFTILEGLKEQDRFFRLTL
ncbi:MAG: hypothetical protein IJR98_05740 [Synergistaceae bacterium]|nr:hypothetical protein [Synergistaceae bacterium]